MFRNFKLKYDFKISLDPFYALTIVPSLLSYMPKSSHLQMSDPCNKTIYFHKRLSDPFPLNPFIWVIHSKEQIGHVLNIHWNINVIKTKISLQKQILRQKKFYFLFSNFNFVRGKNNIVWCQIHYYCLLKIILCWVTLQRSAY